MCFFLFHTRGRGGMSCHFHLRLRHCGISDRAVSLWQQTDRHSRCKSRDVTVTRLTDEKAKPAILARLRQKHGRTESAYACNAVPRKFVKAEWTPVKAITRSCAFEQCSSNVILHLSFCLGLIRAVLYRSCRGHYPRCSASNQGRGFCGGNSR